MGAYSRGGSFGRALNKNFLVIGNISFKIALPTSNRVFSKGHTNCR